MKSLICELCSRMGKSVALGVVTMIVSFGMYEGYIDCYNYIDINREGILGKNVTLRCYTSLECDDVRWDMLLEDNTLGSLSGEQVLVGRYTSYLSIFGIGFHQNGRYRCWCYVGETATKICSVTLKPICQTTVRLKGRRIVYNSSLPNSHFIDVTARETIGIECPQGATLERGCEIAIMLQESNELSTYTFEVLQEHNSCSIGCLLRSGNKDSCSVGFTLNVTLLETSTPHSTTSTVSFHPSVNGKASTTTSTRSVLTVPTAVVTASDKPSVNQRTSTTMPTVQQEVKDNAVPNKSGSFPVMVLIGISIAIFVGILFILCFFIYSSRSKSTSRPKKTQTLGNESPDTNIPIGPTYATVNKSSPGGDEDSFERDTLCTDHAYAEVNSATKEESSPQQVNVVKAETSVTKDYYSVVNTSNTNMEPIDHGNESDSALYTEVNKGVKQAGKKEGTSCPERSGYNSNVPDVQSHDVLEQPESSEYDDVGVVSTSPALYAVVDKDRKKE